MRAQVHTVEAFIAALLLLAGVTFAMQATAVTPLSASTSNQHIENQQRVAADDLLAAADERGELSEAVLFWNASDEAFHGANERSYYVSGGGPNGFGESLDRALGDRRIAFNVRVVYHRTDGTIASTRMVYMGSPSDNAVSASRTVTLYDDSRLTSEEGPGATLAEVNESSTESFYVPDVSEGPLYNVVEVRIVAWRM